MSLSFANNDQPPATKREIALLQTLRGIKLPPPYRDFLLASNGGVPSLALFPGGRGYVIQLFYSLVAKRSWSDLAAKILVFDGRVPHDLIPVAGDPGGSQFCLAVAGERFGQVYFWDHEAEGEAEDGNYYGNLTLLAPSFEQFLAGLVALPPELAPAPAADND